MTPEDRQEWQSVMREIMVLHKVHHETGQKLFALWNRVDEKLNEKEQENEEDGIS